MDKGKTEYFKNSEVTEEFRRDKKNTAMTEAMKRLGAADHFLVLTGKNTPEQTVDFEVMASLDGRAMMHSIPVMGSIAADMLQTLAKISQKEAGENFGGQHVS